MRSSGERRRPFELRPPWLARQRSLRGPVWPRSASPPSLPEEPLQVLAGRDQQRLGVHLPEPSQPEPLEAVPVLGLTEQRLDPDAPLAHGLSVGVGLVVSADTVQVGFVEAPREDPPFQAVGAACLEGTGTAS